MLAACILPLDVEAKECGDAVGGQRIACACGDTVVSDTVLQPADPVVRNRCVRDGLVLRAPALAESIRLSLNGLSLIGMGMGEGIAVQSGGSDGAVIIGGTKERRGGVVGFGVGVNVRVARAARRIESLEVKGHRHEGMILRMAGAMVFDVRAARNGSDGIRVVGQGGRMLGVESTENAGVGIRLSSRYTILSATVQDNRSHGIIVRGSRNDLRGSVANGNRGYGVIVSGTHQPVDGVHTEGNTVGGITTDKRSRKR